MDMKIKGSPLFLIFVIVLMLVMVFSAIPMKYYASKIMPIGLGCIVIVLAAIELSHEFITAKKKEEGEQSVKGWRIILLNLAWLGGFVLFIYLLGFLITIPLFLFLYTKWLGARWLTAIITAVVVLVLVYLIFGVGLKFQLYQGMIFQWLGY